MRRYRAVSKLTGKTFKRTTTNHEYAYCIVHHVKARPADATWAATEGHSKAEWRASLDLARKCANGYSGKAHIYAVEIIKAVEIS
jgi:hypothetical protein